MKVQENKFLLQQNMHFFFCIVLYFCLCVYFMHKNKFTCVCPSALNRALLRPDWERPPAQKANSGPGSTKSIAQAVVYRPQSQMQSQQSHSPALAPVSKLGRSVTLDCLLFPYGMPSASQ